MSPGVMRLCNFCGMEYENPDGAEGYGHSVIKCHTELRIQRDEARELQALAERKLAVESCAAITLTSPLSTHGSGAYHPGIHHEGRGAAPS